VVALAISSATFLGDYRDKISLVRNSSWINEKKKKKQGKIFEQQMSKNCSGTYQTKRTTLRGKSGNTTSLATHHTNEHCVN
jgi:hypothetical protein